MVKALILRVEGTNCDEETVKALQLAGAETRLVHMNELVRKKQSLEDHQLLVIPGGFSHGDDISAGIILANQLKYLIGKDVKKFVEEGKPLLGICNGFQVLVKAGLLPALEGTMKKQEATLAFNNTGMFIDKWVHLEPQKGHRCAFLKNITKTTFIPINHAEGRFIASEPILDMLEERGQVVFKYVENPNGSYRNIAGICNPEGNVFGLMPHPEKHVHSWTHPFWTREKLSETGDGLQFYTGPVEYAKRF